MFGTARACLVALRALAATPGCSLSTGSAAAAASSAWSAASACKYATSAIALHTLTTQPVERNKHVFIGGKS